MLSLKIIPRKSLSDRQENLTVLGHSPTQYPPLRGQSSFSLPPALPPDLIWVGVKEMC